MAATPDPDAEIAFLRLPDGGRVRHARWPARAPFRGSVLMLNGRSEFIEKYAELARDWTGRGFDVFTFDWRGQGLSDRFLANPQKGHVPDYSVHLADLAYYIAHVLRPSARGPHILFAHSMGGHIALRHLATNGVPFVGAILSAPMVDIRTGPFPRALARSLARGGVACGLGGSYAPGHGDYDPAAHRFETNKLTHDPVRWAVHHEEYRRNPDLIVGGVTYGWVDATFRSVAELDRPGTVENIALPVLMLSAPEDVLVPVARQDALCRRLPDCEQHHYPDAHHELLMETDAIRDRVWADIDDFVARIAGPSETG